jgi:hypothetical protein
MNLVLVENYKTPNAMKKSNISLFQSERSHKDLVFTFLQLICVCLRVTKLYRDIDQNTIVFHKHECNAWVMSAWDK